MLSGSQTQTFVGQFAVNLLKEITVSKAFIGANGIDGHNVTTANEEEGNVMHAILNNAIENKVVAITSKFDKEVLSTLYRLDDRNAIVTDDNISQRMKDKYQSYTKVL